MASWLALALVLACISSCSCDANDPRVRAHTCATSAFHPSEVCTFAVPRSTCSQQPSLPWPQVSKLITLRNKSPDGSIRLDGSQFEQLCLSANRPYHLAVFFNSEQYQV